MIRSKYHTEQKEKGKAAHDKESSDKTGAPQQKG
jgi:hypothetical protein